MISHKHRAKVFAFFMALLMTCIVSFVISLYNFGWNPNSISTWLKAWLLSFAIAFPTIMMISPMIHRLVAFVLDDEGQNNK